MESEKFICVREQAGDSTRLAIINLQTGASPARLPLNADSAIMNPVSQVIAVRGECRAGGRVAALLPG